MTAPNYPEWAGRLGAHLGAMLGDPSDAVRELAARDHAEWQRLTGHADRMTSALGDRRERSVECLYCRADTWFIDRVCKSCHEQMADIRTTGDGSAA